MTTPYKISALSADASPQAATVVRALTSARFEVVLCRDAFELFGKLHDKAGDAGVLAVGLDAASQATLGQLSDTLAALGDMGVALTPVFVVGPPGAQAIQAALASGAADYISELDAESQLSARIDAHLRARRRSLPRTLRMGSCELNWDTSSLSAAGKSHSLTPHEFALASVLFLHPGQAVPAEAFAMRVWGRPGDLCRHTLEQHIYRLRRKLENTGLRIRTVYKVGYRLDTVVHQEKRGRERRSEARSGTHRPDLAADSVLPAVHPHRTA